MRALGVQYTTRDAIALRCSPSILVEMCFLRAPRTDRGWVPYNTRLHTPTAVTYHEQSHIINHDRSQPWAYGIQGYKSSTSIWSYAWFARPLYK